MIEKTKEEMTPKRKRGRPKKGTSGIKKEPKESSVFSKADVMKYKHEKGISLKDAWKEMKGFQWY
jgi:hypothetical protein